MNVNGENAIWSLIYLTEPLSLDITHKFAFLSHLENNLFFKLRNINCVSITYKNIVRFGGKHTMSSCRFKSESDASNTCKQIYKTKRVPIHILLILLLTNSFFTSICKIFNISFNIFKSGRMVSLHHLLTVQVDFPSCSANHFPIFWCSTRTNFSKL